MDSGGGSLGKAQGEITLSAAGALRSLNQVSDGFKNLQRTTEAQSSGILSFASTHEQAFGTIRNGLLGVGGVFLGAFGLATNTALSFEKQMSAVGSVTGSVGKDLNALREEALRLGADTSFSASEAAQAMEIMAKAGVSVQSILGGATEDIMNLATATGSDVPEAAEVAAAAMKVFGVSSEEAANVISRSANVSSIDVRDWGLAMKSAGPVAAALGYDIDDLASAMIILGDAGTTGEVAATALRNIMINLADSSGEAATALGEYGVAVTNADGSVRELDAVTGDLATTWATLTDEQRLQLAQSVAGRDGAAAFMTIMDAQTKAVQDNSNAFDVNKDRMGEVGTAAEQAEQRLDNFAGSWDRLKGTVETIAISFGSTVLPVLRSVVDGINVLLQGVLSLPAPVQTAIMAFAGIAGVLATAGAGFLFLLPRIAETRDALQTLSKADGVLGRLSSGVLNLGGSLRSATVHAGGLRGALLGVTRMHPLLTGLGLVAGAIGIAYRTNFLGIGDAIDGIAGKVKGVFAEMSAAFNASGESASVAAEDVAAFAEATHVVDGVTVYTAFTTNADGTKREVGEIIESVANADGKTAQVKIKGDDGVYWAQIDLLTGEISNAEIPVTANTVPLTDRINSALEVLKGKFNDAGMGWAASIVGHMQTMVTGISRVATVVQAAFAKMSPRVKDFAAKIVAGAAVLAPFAAGISLIAKGLSTLGPAVSLVMNVVRGLGIAMAVLTSPIGLIVVGIAALAAGLVFAYQHFEPFRNAVDSLASALKSLATGAITQIVEAFTKLKDAFDEGGFSELFSTLGDMLLNGLQTVSNAILDGVQALGSMFADAFRGIDWGGIVSGAWDVLSGAGGWLIGKLGDIGSSLWSWLSDAATGVDWQGALSTAWDVFTNVGSWLVGKFGDVIAAIGTWAVDQFQGVDWTGAFQTAVDILSSAGLWIVEKLGDLATSLFGWFAGAVLGVDWKGILTGAWDLLKGAGGWIKDIIASGWGAFEGWFTDVANGIIAIVNRIIDGINALYTWMGAPPIPNIEPIRNEFESLGVAIEDVASKNFNNLQAHLDRIKNGAKDAATSVRDVLGAAFGNVSHDRQTDSTPGNTPGEVTQPDGTTPIAVPEADAGGFRGIQSALEGITTAARGTNAELGVSRQNLGALIAQNPNVQSFGTVATTSFTGIGSAAQTGLGPIGGIAAGMAAALTGAALPAFSGVQLSAATNFASMLTATTSNFAGMNSSATSEASAMNRSVSAEALGMQVSMLGKLALLKATSTLHFMGMAASAREQGTAMSTALRTGANNAASAVSSALSRIPGIINGIAGQGAAAAYNAGAAISAGFANGMLAYLGQIQSAASAMVAAASAAVVAKAMISSPSRLFRGFGEYVGEGFEIGIRSMIPDVSRAAAALVATPSLPGYGSGYSPAYAYSSPASSSVSNVTYQTTVLTIPPDEWVAMARQAERGGTHATAWQQTDEAASRLRPGRR